jgi:hypothetical protein
MLSYSVEKVGHVTGSISYNSNMFCFSGEADFNIVDRYKVATLSKFDKKFS